MSRRLRSHLPNTKSQLKPQVVDSEKMKKKLEEKQVKQKQCYDKGSKKLSTLEEEESMRVQVKSKHHDRTLCKCPMVKVLEEIDSI